MRARFITSVVTGLLLGALALPVGVAAAPQSSLSGHVLAHDGRGLADATVTAYALPGLSASCAGSETQWRPVASTRTARGGGYLLSVAPGWYRLGVVPDSLRSDAFGYWTASTQPDGSDVTSWLGVASDVDARSGAVVDVRLTTPAMVTGQVTEGAMGATGVVDTGKPLGDVEVSAVPFPGNYYALTGYVPTATTGANGRYTIRGLPVMTPDPDPSTPANEALQYGTMFVDTHQRHVIWLWYFATGDPAIPAVDLSVPGPYIGNGTPVRSARLDGRVIDTQGRPIAGIAVDPLTMFAYPPVLTGADGRFSVAVLPVNADGTSAPLRFVDPRGRYLTTFSSGVEHYSQATGVAVSIGKTVRYTQVLQGGAASAVGTAVRSDGSPAAGVLIGTAGDPPGAYGNTATAGCDGRFEVTGLWPADTTIGWYFQWYYNDFSPPVQATLVPGERWDVGTVVPGF